MVLQTEQNTKKERAVVLPRLLHLGSIFGLRFPLLTALICLVEGGACFYLLVSIEILPLWITAVFIGMCVACLLMILYAGWSIWSSHLLDDLADLVGENECKSCLAWANVEVRLSIIPALVTGFFPLVGYMMEKHSSMGDHPLWERALVYASLAYSMWAGFFLSLSFFGGHLALVRLVVALLKLCVRKHFTHLEATLTSEGLSQEQTLEKLGAHIKRMKRAFDKANKCITPQIFGTVVLAFLTSLVMVLQIVVSVRNANKTRIFTLILLGGMGGLACAVAIALLYAMTTVADVYEDVASELSHDMKLRFKLTGTFPGPAGVKLLKNYENSFVNDLSFNFHHRPMDARVMEATMIKVFMGAVVTVVLGVLR